MPSIDVDGVTIQLPPDDSQAQKVPQYNAAFIALAEEVAALSLGMDASSAHLSGDLLVDGTITGGFIVGDGAGLTNVVNSFNTREGAVTLVSSDLNGLSGAGLVGISSGTGGISNTGSTSIDADTDTDGVGVVALRTRNTTRFQVNNDGTLNVIEKLGINTASPLAKLHLTVTGSGETWGRITPSAGPAAFNLNTTEFTNTGSVRKNQVTAMGWNLDTGGGAAVAGEAFSGIGFEDYYFPTADANAPYLETHFYFGSTAGVQVRPISFIYSQVTDETTGRISAQSFRQTNTDGSQDFSEITDTLYYVTVPCELREDFAIDTVSGGRIFHITTDGHVIFGTDDTQVPNLVSNEVESSYIGPMLRVKQNVTGNTWGHFAANKIISTKASTATPNAIMSEYGVTVIATSSIGFSPSSTNADPNVSNYPDAAIERGGVGVVKVSNVVGGVYAALDALEIRASGTKVLGARATGWGAPTGTATRTTFATSTVTLPDLAERVKALIDDLTTHGAIGT